MDDNTVISIVSPLRVCGGGGQTQILETLSRFFDIIFGPCHGCQLFYCLDSLLLINLIIFVIHYLLEECFCCVSLRFGGGDLNARSDRLISKFWLNGVNELIFVLSLTFSNCNWCARNPTPLYPLLDVIIPPSFSTKLIEHQFKYLRHLTLHDAELNQLLMLPFSYKAKCISRFI